MITLRPQSRDARIRALIDAMRLAAVRTAKASKLVVAR